MDGGCGSERLPRKQHHVSVAPRVLCLQLLRWREAGLGGAVLHEVMLRDVLLQEQARTLRHSAALPGGSHQP